MILLDANLLIYAKVASFPQHLAAKRWLDQKLTGSTLEALRAGIRFASMATADRTRRTKAKLGRSNALTNRTLESTRAEKAAG